MSVTSSPLDASLQEVDVHPPVTGKFKSVNRNLAKPSPSLRDFPSTPNPPIASIFGAAMSEVNGERGYDEGGERSNEVGFILSRGLGRIISLSNLTFLYKALSIGDFRDFHIAPRPPFLVVKPR